MGTINDAPGNLTILLRTAAAYAVLLAPAALLMLVCGRAGRRRRRLAAVLVVAEVVLMIRKYDAISWGWTARPWPLFMVILAAATLVWFARSRRSPDRGAPAALAVMTTVFALVLLSKILLNCRIISLRFRARAARRRRHGRSPAGLGARVEDRAGGFGNGFRALALT